MGAWVDSLEASLLVSLRLAPTLAFAQPFSLVRVPVMVRLLIAIGLSLWLVDARPALTAERLAGHSFVGLMAGELAIGVSIALALQLAFGAILWAGGVLDFQAGYGLATLAAKNGGTTVQSTAGIPRSQASAAGRTERLRAERAGTPYRGQAGHVPDSALSGTAQPPAGWLDMPGRSNSVVGGGLSSRIGQRVDVITVDGRVP